MSEGRQLVLLLASGLVLAVVGVVGASVFPEPCEELEGIGELALGFEDASVLSLESPAAEVEQLGDQLGIGPWRGAVRLPAGASVLPSDFGFFVVTATDLVALRPGSGIASAPRDRAGVGVVPVAGTAVGLVTESGTIGVIASDYERARCGELPADADVLAIDRGFALLATDDGAALRTLSGDEVWSTDVVGVPVAAVIHEDHALLVGEGAVASLTLRDGTVVDERPRRADGEPLVSVGDRVMDRVGTDGVRVLALAPDGGIEESTVTVTGAVVDAASTPLGTVVLSDRGLATDRDTGGVAWPAPLPATELITSEDGHVGVVVDAVDGDGRVLLVWGRDV